MFGRATIRLGIGPHSSYYYFSEPANLSKGFVWGNRQTCSNSKMARWTKLKVIINNSTTNETIKLRYKYALISTNKAGEAVSNICSLKQMSGTSNLTGSDSFICISPYLRFLTVTATKNRRVCTCNVTCYDFTSNEARRTLNICSKSLGSVVCAKVLSWQNIIHHTYTFLSCCLSKNSFTSVLHYITAFIELIINIPMSRFSLEH